MINIGDIDLINVKPNDRDLKILSGKTAYHYDDVEKLEEVNNVQEVLRNLDKDEVQEDNLTTIDFNTRLGESEVAPIVALQLLHTLRVGGSACSLITRSIKRHKVSLGGRGREEKVRIIQGEREHEGNTGEGSLFGKIKGFIGKKKNDE